ncbi:MAG: glycosyltransferase family 2 protein [Bryocella sp.]
MTSVSVVVPALNEAEAIGGVVRSMPWGSSSFDFAECIVVDNGSTDGTGDVARAAGARVVTSPRGYGAACDAGAKAAVGEVLVFLDGDGADNVGQFDDVAGPVVRGEADFVIGSRIRGRREKGAMNFSQVFAAHLIGALVKVMYGFRYTDMGAFRAIRKDALERMGMTEMTFGWNLEMQVRAVQMGLRIVEVPVDYGCRTAGESKVSGNLRASVTTAWKIFGVLVRTRKSSK